MFCLSYTLLMTIAFYNNCLKLFKKSHFFYNIKLYFSLYGLKTNFHFHTTCTCLIFSRKARKSMMKLSFFPFLKLASTQVPHKKPPKLTENKITPSLLQEKTKVDILNGPPMKKFGEISKMTKFWIFCSFWHFFYFWGLLVPRPLIKNHHKSSLPDFFKQAFPWIVFLTQSRFAK